MFERYSERARRAIFFARYEASQYGSHYIETEHLLLGLIREDRTLAHRFLGQGPSIGSIRLEIESQIIVRERIPTSVEVPLSQESKRVLNYVAEEAERLNHRQVTTEHLLLGILREEKSLAATILRKRGVTLTVVREVLSAAPLSVDEALRSKPRHGNVVTVREGMESAEMSELALQLLAAWIEQDAQKFAGFFHQEGRFVDPHGDLWIGQQDIARGAGHLFSFSEGAKVQGEIEDIKCVGEDVAVITAVWEINAESQDPQSIKLRMTVVMTDTSHGWTIVSAHVTEMRSPSPPS